MAKTPGSVEEELCRALMEELPGPAALLTPGGRILFANAAFCQIFALEAATARGREMEDVLSPGSSAWIFFNDRLENAEYTKEPLAFALELDGTENPHGAQRLHFVLKRLSADGYLVTASAPRAATEPATLAAEDESALRYTEIKRCPPALVALVQKALGDFISRINSVLKARDLRLLASQLHGLKGTTLMVGLKSIASRVHRLETELTASDAQSRFQAGQFDATIAALTEDMAETRRLFGVAHDTTNAKSDASGDVYDSIQRLFTKYDQLISARPSFGARIAAERIDWAIRSVNRSPVSDLREFFKSQINNAAKTTGKTVDLEWQSEALPVDEDARKILIELFTHLATNSVVHGLEANDERQALKKPPAGRVRVQLHHDGAIIKGIVSDDGRGIDPNKIKAHAIQKALRPAAEIEALDDEAALQLIFEHGFSTSKEVNQLSGRGVGLDAVVMALKRGEGEIRVLSKVGSGTEFRFWFRPPTSRPSVKKLLTYKALHNQLMGVTGYQAENEQLPIHFDEEMENASSIETGMVYADEIQLMTALSGLLGQLAARSSCEIKMQVNERGQVQLFVNRKPLARETLLPEQYPLLNETFSDWIRLNGGAVNDSPDGTVVITIGGTMTGEALPLLEVRSAPDLSADDFAAVRKAVEVAGRSLGFDLAAGDAEAPVKPKLVLLATYAHYERKAGELAVHYQQHPAEIKSTLLTAMESLLKAA